LVPSIELRQDGAPIPGRRISMGTNETRNITIRIPLMPTSFASQTFTLQFEASAGGLSGSESRSFTVGQVVVPPDPNIVSNQTGTVVINTSNGTIETDPANGRLDGSTIRLRAGRQMVVQFNTQFLMGGTYDLTLASTDGAPMTGWTLGLVSTPASITAPAGGDTAPRLVQIGVTAAAGATADNIRFRIQRQGATQDWFKDYAVELLS
jgi:hypothetical protein